MTKVIYLEWYGGYEPFRFDELIFWKGLEQDNDSVILADGYAIVRKGLDVYLLVAMNGEYYDIYRLGSFNEVLEKLEKMLRR